MGIIRYLSLAPQ